MCSSDLSCRKVKPGVVVGVVMELIYQLLYLLTIYLQVQKLVILKVVGDLVLFVRLLGTCMKMAILVAKVLLFNGNLINILLVFRIQVYSRQNMQLVLGTIHKVILT